MLDIPVVSMPALSAMNIFTWKDRSPGNTQDALDLEFLLRNYLDAGNSERFAKEHTDRLDDDFDYEQAGSRLMAKDIAQIMRNESREYIR